MDFLDTDDEIDFQEKDIKELCREYQDEVDIDTIILRREKKAKRQFFEEANLDSIIEDMEIGKKITEKYNLAIQTQTPIDFIYEDKEGNIFTIRDKLKNNTEILEALNTFKNDYTIGLREFVFAYYFSNQTKSKDFLIEQLNKISNLTDEIYRKEEWVEKRNRFNTIFEDRMKITQKKFEKIKEFYSEINKLPFSTSPKEINDSLFLEKTKIEVTVRIENYLFDIDSGSIIFDDIRLNKNFLYLQYNSFDDKYYKIYDKNINIETIIAERNNAFANLEESGESEKENMIYLLAKLDLINKTQYILLIFDLENSKLTFEYPATTSTKIYKELSGLIPGINFRDEKTISIKGSFMLNIDNFKDLNLYYLTLFDKKISNFLYVNENKRPRSLMKNVKYYYKSYEERFLEADYFITFHLEQIYVNKYLLVFRSKIINQENNINEFALVMSKLLNYYQNYDFGNTDLPIITNPYTGKDGDGLGDDFEEEEDKVVTKGNKLLNLRNIAPEIFPPSVYARKCGCEKQPIIIDEEDVEDWREYKGDEAISVFPPPNSSQRVRKKHIFVCPSEYSVMNYIINPDKESPFPILPCCSLQKKNNYYANYDKIQEDPEKFFNIKTDQKDATKGQLKTINPLTTTQKGALPEQLSQFLNDIYNGASFQRYGVLKNSKSSFLHCCLLASSHLKNIKPYISNPRYQKNLKYLEQIRDSYLKQDISTRDLWIIKLKGYLIENKGIKINREILSQELYNYDEDFIKYTLENEVFDSNIFYRLCEYLFFVNIFVFIYDGDNIKLEKPRHLYYHQREIRKDLPSLLIFKHENTTPPVYELISVDGDFLFDQKVAQYMQNYIDDYGYYLAEFQNQEYHLTKNFYNNINWNYILRDYEIVGQFINDAGRCYAINFRYKKDDDEDCILSIFFDSSFPIDAPRATRVYKADRKTIKKLFGSSYVEGSEGLWYSLNMKEKSLFIPAEDISEKSENICHDYLVTQQKSKFQIKFKNLNIAKRNANILSQIILWIWNISPEKDLDKWFKNYIAIGDKRAINSINNTNLKINYRFPLGIKTAEEAIEYYSDYLPTIFGKNQIFLYDQLEEAIYHFIKNYITKTQGYGKMPNKAIVGIFNNEVDFTKKTNNKIIIGEKNFDEWVNFLENINSNDIISSCQKRGYLYKNKNGNIFIIQNNINNSLNVSLLISKVWRSLKINLGYYTTMVNIWHCISKIDGLMKVLNLDEEKVIEIAKRYQPNIIDFQDAISILKKENHEYELEEEDFNYITTNTDEYINKENFILDDPYNLFSYENGALASMLNIG